jgi:hypothetical protein
MATRIILKKSSITGRIPDQSTLDYGELAINYTDGVLYYKNSSNVVQSISAGLDSDLTLQLIDSSYAAISASLIPATDSTYDLGTADKKWRELYLSGNTIHLGDSKLSADASGNIEVRDNNGQLKKIVVDEIEVGTGANKVKLKGNNGKLRVDNTSDTQQKLDFSLNTTSDLTEGTNKYYTDARVQTLVNSSYIQARQIRGADSSWVSSEITSAVDNLVNGAPGALDTLNEIATAYADADSDLQALITNNGTRLTTAESEIDTLQGWGNHADAGYITGYTVSQSDVTQHQAALSITESQISDLVRYADSDVRVLVDSSYVNDRVTITENQISSVVDSDYILSKSTSVELYDGYNSLLSRHQLRLKADAQVGHLVLVGQILVEDSQGSNPTLRDVSFHSPLAETMISIDTLKATVAASTDFADFQARIAAL